MLPSLSASSEMSIHLEPLTLNCSGCLREEQHSERAARDHSSRGPFRPRTPLALSRLDRSIRNQLRAPAAATRPLTLATGMSQNPKRKTSVCNPRPARSAVCLPS